MLNNNKINNSSKINDKKMININFFKKSQISIFVIVAIIMVILGFFLFFNSKLEIFTSHDTKIKNQVSEVINGCIEDIAISGIDILAYQAGYIYLPDYISKDYRKYIDLGLKIPTWDSQRGDIPTILSMQNELERYIKDNMKLCVNSNLLEMKDFFDINTSSSLDVIVEINPENVEISVNYPIIFNEKNSQEKLSVNDFYVNLDSIRLGDMFNLAVQIYNLEQREYFLENLVLDQINSASDYSDRHLSMPSEGMDITCTPRIWTKSILKENLANMNNNNFKYLQFSGLYDKTDLMNLNVPKDLQDYYKNRYRFNLENPKKSFKNFDVIGFMPSKEITGQEGYIQRYPYREFEVVPSSGEIVKSQEMKIDTKGMKIPIPCIQLYHHVYSLDYDIVMKIIDYNEDSQGFFFQFPLRVEIKENQPKVLPPYPIISEGALATNDKYCNESERIYPLDVFVFDTSTNRPISDVNISYKCLSFSCDIGETQVPTFQGVKRIGAEPYLRENFPYCFGGKIIAQKEGYHKGEVRVNTPYDESLSAPEIYITPLKTFYLDAGSFLLVDKNTNRGFRVRDENDGSVYVTIENKDKEFESFGMWPNDGDYFNKINLLDDSEVRYNVSVIYVDSEGEFKGILKQDNWLPDLHLGNRISFTLPYVSTGITEDMYIEFFQQMQDLMKTSLSSTNSAIYGAKIS